MLYLPENLTQEWLSQLANEVSLKLKNKHNQPIRSSKIAHAFAEIFGYSDWKDLTVNVKSIPVKIILVRLPNNIKQDWISQFSNEISLKLKNKHNRTINSGDIRNDLADIFGHFDWNTLISTLSPKAVKVFIQRWEESERGWGTRPDGYSVHFTDEDRITFCNNFMNEQETRLGDSTPDEYDRPERGSVGELYVTLEKMEELIKSTNGIRIYDKNPDWTSEEPLY
jgi:hypothetical protein